MILRDNGQSNVVDIAKMPRMPKSVSFGGDDNSVEIGPRSELAGGTVSMRGSRNRLRIGSNSKIKGEIFFKGHDSTVLIGDNVTIVGCRVTLGQGTTLEIGHDCLFSRGVEIRTTDEHPIYSRSSGELLNPDKDVFIGDHVWLGRSVTVGKGASILTGCVIGTCSIVTGRLDEPHAVYVGSPATLQKRDIVWARVARPSE